MVELLNIDCMEYMAGLPDKAFDIAIVDPPYGINASKGTWGSSNKGRVTNYGKKEWDKNTPSGKYFDELFRISQNQIIWGCNYFVQYLNSFPSYIVWDKLNTADFADCEMAWYSVAGAARVFRFRWNGMIQGDMKNKEERIHPTQKPKALYKWLMENYCDKGMKIIDTHLGSFSSAIVAEKMGFDFVGCEIDKEIFDKGYKRFKKETDLGLFSAVGK